MNYKMNTFSINSIQDARIFNQFLNESWKRQATKSLLDENYFEKQFKTFYETNRRLFYALIDLEIIYFFMLRNIDGAGGKWNDIFSPGKLEGGTVLDNIQKFNGKLEILENFSAFSFRCRTFWDKYMGILVLLLSPEEYDKYCKAKSRKKKFKNIASNWSTFPIPIQDSLIDCLQISPTTKKYFQPYKNKGGLFPEPFLEIFF